jgi:hypothetical protein
MNRRDRGIDRREFLITSSTCAAVALAVGPTAFADATGETPSRFAVGFVRTDDVATTDDAVIGNVRAARRVASGESRFVGSGAAVTVLGIAPAEGSNVRRTSALVAHFEIADGDQRISVPFSAWGMNRQTGCSGKPVSFMVPVEESGKVSLSLLPAASESKEIISRRSLFSRDENEGPVPVTLSLRGGRGTTKLMQGYYVIVPLYGREREPRWSSYRLRMRNHRYALENVIDSRAAGFEHAVVRIANIEEQA